MTSIRENIALDIMSTLTDFQRSGVQFRKAVRAPFDISDAPRTVFPLAVLTTADEERQDITLGGSGITRMGTITYWIDIHVWGEQNDSQLNEMIELVEEALDVDRERDGNALDTMITFVALTEPTSARPWTTARVTVTVEYCFNRGEA